MIWVLYIKEETMRRSAQLIREVVLRRFLHRYAVAGILLRNMMVIHLVICANDRTTHEAGALTRSTSTWWWKLQDVHRMDVR